MCKTSLVIAATLLLGACGSKEPASQSQSDASFESRLQEQLLDAEPAA